MAITKKEKVREYLEKKFGKSLSKQAITSFSKNKTDLMLRGIKNPSLIPKLIYLPNTGFERKTLQDQVNKKGIYIGESKGRALIFSKK